MTITLGDTLKKPSYPRRRISSSLILSGPDRRERGIALVVVLWVTVLLTIIVSSFAYSVRTHVQSTGSQVSRAQAAALADAGVHRALYELLKPATDGARWKAQGQQNAFELGAGKVVVKIVNESAFIDLNYASENLLLSLFTSVGLDAGEAQAMVDAIEDWRDADDLPRLSGAERDQYQAAGLKQVPANQNFRTVDELKSVLGMTPDLFAHVSGALTVYTKSTGIDASVAVRQVLLALPNVKAEEVDAYLAVRQDELAAGQVPTPFPAAAGFTGGATSMVYNLRSEAVLPDGSFFVREAVVRLTGDTKRPFDFLDWREARP